MTSLTYRFQYTGSWNWVRAYVDRDRTIGTGFNYNGVGAEFLIENGVLYRYAGSGPNWSWAAVSPNPVVQTTGPIDGMTFVQWDLNQSDLGSTTKDVNLLFEVESPVATSTGYVVSWIAPLSNVDSWNATEASISRAGRRKRRDCTPASHVPLSALFSLM